MTTMKEASMKVGNRFNVVKGPFKGYKGTIRKIGPRMLRVQLDRKRRDRRYLVRPTDIKVIEAC